MIWIRSIAIVPYHFLEHEGDYIFFIQFIQLLFFNIFGDIEASPYKIEESKELELKSMLDESRLDSHTLIGSLGLKLGKNAKN